MPAGLGPLGDDEIGVDVHRLPGLVEVGDLDDQRGSGPANGLDQGPWVAKGQHDGRGPALHRALDRGRVGRPGLETDAPGLVRPGGNDLELLVEPAVVLPAAADQAQAAGVGHRRRQRAPGRSAHGRQRDGVLQREELRERRPQRHVPIIACHA